MNKSELHWTGPRKFAFSRPVQIPTTAAEATPNENRKVTEEEKILQTTSDSMENLDLNGMEMSCVLINLDVTETQASKVAEQNNPLVTGSCAL